MRESVVYYSGTSAPRKKEAEKNFKKVLKNPLTNSRECGIIVRLSKRTARQEQSESSDRSLTIEQQEIKVQAKLSAKISKFL